MERKAFNKFNPSNMKQELLLISSILILAIAVTPKAGAQWVQTSGPAGCYVTTFATIGASGPTPIIFAGTYGQGVYRSTDDGTSWRASGTGLPAKSKILSFALMGTTLFAGTLDSAVFISKDSGANWSATVGSLGTTHIYALASMGQRLFAASILGGLFLTTNSGTSWAPASSGLTSAVLTGLAVCGPNLFASTFSDGVILSTDSGSSWNPVD